MPFLNIPSDVAVMDSKGYIRLVGRSKEMIIRGGENIYPKEIEELLHQHPNVYEVFVCGVPDERMGEEICAWVKLKDDDGSSGAAVTEDDIKNFCKDKVCMLFNMTVMGTQVVSSYHVTCPLNMSRSHHSKSHDTYYSLMNFPGLQPERHRSSS